MWGRGFHQPVPAMIVMIMWVTVVVTGAPVARGNCVVAVLVAMGDC